MKNMMTICSVFAATAGTALASITPVSYSNPLLGVDGSQSTQGSPAGDAFFVAPGLGNGGGFFLAGGPFADSAIGNVGDVIGAGLGVSDIAVDSSVFDNGGGNFDVRVFLYSLDGSDMFPTGFVDGGGLPLDAAAFFLGANGGGDPIDFSGVAFTNSASIELFDAAGPAGGPFDISGFANFSGLGGGWDGSLGVSFGSGSAGLGINAIELLVNVTVVPAPAGLAPLAMVGLVASRRRRA